MKKLSLALVISLLALSLIGVPVSATTLTIDTVSLADAELGVPYFQPVVATGGFSPYAWSATGLPAGLTISTGGIISGSPITSCDFTVTITVSDSFVPPNIVSKVFALHVDPCGPAPSPDMQLIKIATLVKDADGDGLVGPGDTIKYAATLTNVGSAAATGVTFSDTPDINTALVAGSVIANQGFVLKGNIAGDSWVAVSFGVIPAGGIATVTFEVSINKPLWEHQIVNQAIVTGANFSSVKSDDPGTDQPGDPTITQVKTSPPVHGPGVSLWGIMALAMLLGGSMIWMIRRKQILSGA
jgi:uncharacterized repeat protein (TIGR01451 family)